MNTNFQQLLNIASQMKKMGNPQKSLTPEQQKIANEFNGKTEQEKAQIIADKLNSIGMTKEQLQMLMSIK